MNLTTLQFRIKDETSRKHLIKMSHSVNFVWNYCNEVNQERWNKFRKTYSEFDLNNKTAGCSKDLGILSETIQAICGEFSKYCKQNKKVKLRWRSKSKSLGWIPFKYKAVQIKGGSVVYCGHTFKFWKSREIEGNIRCGSFSQDSKGRWYINLVVESPIKTRVQTGKSCGIDLGLKTLITLSDGLEFTRENLTKKFEQKLAVAQRARKKKQVTAIHAKIKNKRKDWNHKISSLLVAEYDTIVVGNVSSSKLIKTKMAKSVSDAGWFDFKRMLAYKAITLGSEFKEVNESFSTVTCSACNERSGPKGLHGLKVREWICSCCGFSHLRDINAAKNILSFSLRDI